MYETFTTYYPSDEEIANDWKDRRIKRIKEVPKKRYYYSGQEMLDMLLILISAKAAALSMMTYIQLWKKYAAKATVSP